MAGGGRDLVREMARESLQAFVLVFQHILHPSSLGLEKPPPRNGTPRNCLRFLSPPAGLLLLLLPGPAPEAAAAGGRAGRHLCGRHWGGARRPGLPGSQPQRAERGGQATCQLSGGRLKQREQQSRPECLWRHHPCLRRACWFSLCFSCPSFLLLLLFPIRLLPFWPTTSSLLCLHRCNAGCWKELPPAGAEPTPRPSRDSGPALQAGCMRTKPRRCVSSHSESLSDQRCGRWYWRRWRSQAAGSVRGCCSSTQVVALVSSNTSLPRPSPGELGALVFGMAEPCKRPASPPHPEAPITQRAKAEERLAGGPAAAWPPPGLPSWVDRRRHPLAAAPFPCPACGLETLTEECGGFEICGACFWEDDGMWDSEYCARRLPSVSHQGQAHGSLSTAHL